MRGVCIVYYIMCIAGVWEHNAFQLWLHHVHRNMCGIRDTVPVTFVWAVVAYINICLVWYDLQQPVNGLGIPLSGRPSQWSTVTGLKANYLPTASRVNVYESRVTPLKVLPLLSWCKLIPVYILSYMNSIIFHFKGWKSLKKTIALLCMKSSQILYLWIFTAKWK